MTAKKRKKNAPTFENHRSKIILGPARDWPLHSPPRSRLRCGYLSNLWNPCMEIQQESIFYHHDSLQIIPQNFLRSQFFRQRQYPQCGILVLRFRH